MWEIFSRVCQEALADWLGTRQLLGCTHDGLFIKDRCRRLGDQGLMSLIQRIRAVSDLREARHITPHAIRHAAATRMLKRGGDLRSIQEILGHSSLQTTATYLHTTEEQLKKVVELSTFAERNEAERRVEEQPEARRSRYQRSDRRRR
jgi:site-specific recombinase XerD